MKEQRLICRFLKIFLCLILLLIFPMSAHAEDWENTGAVPGSVSATVSTPAPEAKSEPVVTEKDPAIALEPAPKSEPVKVAEPKLDPPDTELAPAEITQPSPAATSAPTSSEEPTTEADSPVSGNSVGGTGYEDGEPVSTGPETPIIEPSDEGLSTKLVDNAITEEGTDSDFDKTSPNLIDDVEPVEDPTDEADTGNLFGDTISGNESGSDTHNESEVNADETVETDPEKVVNDNTVTEVNSEFAEGEDAELSADEEDALKIQNLSDSTTNLLTEDGKAELLNAISEVDESGAVTVKLTSKHFISQEELWEYYILSSLEEGDEFPLEIPEIDYDILNSISNELIYVKDFETDEYRNLDGNLTLKLGERALLEIESPIWDDIQNENVMFSLVNKDGKITVEFVTKNPLTGEFELVESPKFNYFEVNDIESKGFELDEENNILTIFNFFKTLNEPMAPIPTYDEVKYEFDLEEISKTLEKYSDEEIDKYYNKFGDYEEFFYPDNPSLDSDMLKYDLIFNGAFHGYYLENDKSLVLAPGNLD